MGAAKHDKMKLRAGSAQSTPDNVKSGIKRKLCDMSGKGPLLGCWKTTCGDPNGPRPWTPRSAEVRVAGDPGRPSALGHGGGEGAVVANCGWGGVGKLK